MGVAAEHRCLGVPIKHVSLVILTFQTSAHFLIMHYSRIMPLAGGHRYFSSTVVFLNEVMKLAISLTVAMYDISRTLPPSTPMTVLFAQLYHSIFSGDGWKLAIPATLYTFTNSLQYIAVSNLDVVHFQILYQLKILTTAIFSVAMLRRSLSARRWLALVLLMIGVAIVHLPADGEALDFSQILVGTKPEPDYSRAHEVGAAPVEVAAELTKRVVTVLKRSATYEGIEEDTIGQKPVMNYTIGFIAVVVAAVISGLTGVYFERLLKQSSTPASIWTRNVQLSFYALFPALIGGVGIMDGEEIMELGFFEGYNAVVWTLIVVSAIGGLVVSMVIQYGDNIVRNFATSISIIFSFLFSVWMFDFEITSTFLLGTALVMFATYLYNDSENDAKKLPPIKIVAYEKTTIDGQSIAERERPSSALDPFDGMRGMSLSTSRPSTPVRKVSSSKRED